MPPASFPGYLFVELTRRCNLECSYCYNAAGPRGAIDALSASSVLALLREAQVLGSTRCVLSGGEPMLHPDYDRIVLDSPLPIAVLTNGTLLETWWRRSPEVLRRPFEYRVSLDGWNAQADLRGSRSQTVIAGLRLLRQENVSFSVNTMLTERSVPELPRLYDLMLELRPTAWRLDFVFNAGRQREAGTPNRPDPARLYPVLASLVARFLSGSPFSLEIASAFKPSMVSAGFYNYHSAEHPCSYHLDNMCVASNGDAIFCPSFPTRFGNTLGTEGLAGVHASEEMRKFRAGRVQDIEECQGCRFLRICGTGCRADALFSGGRAWGRDPEACSQMTAFEHHILPILPQWSQDAFREALLPGGWIPA
jgi:radical SAM protein with 4Fe4S-binding SPASM domain